MANLLYVTKGDVNDAALITLLETVHTVTEHDTTASGAIPGDAGDYDCIVIGRSVGSGDIGTSYRDLAVPLVAPGSGWLTELEFTASLSTNGSSASIVVSDAAHAIAVAAGLSAGTQTIADSNNTIIRADGLGPEAEQIAYHFQTSRHTFFAYDTGAEMANSTLAPARRVGLGFVFAADSLNALGEACVFESITWAIGAGGGGSDVTGTGSATLGSLTASAAGTVAVAGSGTAALPSLAASAAGAVAVAGSGTADLPALSASGTGAVDVVGAGVVILPTLSASGTGVATESGADVVGSGAAVLGSLEASGAGTVQVVGAGSVVLPGLAAAGAGTIQIVGSGSLSLPAMLATGAGAVAITGTGSATLPSLTASGFQLGPELDLRPPFTAAWINPTRTAAWVQPSRTASLTDPARTATWKED